MVHWRFCPSTMRLDRHGGRWSAMVARFPHGVKKEGVAYLVTHLAKRHVNLL